MQKLNQAGLTLIEVLIVVSLVSALVAGGAVYLFQARENTQVKNTGQIVLGQVKEVQNNALTAQNGLGWGFSCAGNNFTTFSYAPTDPDTQLNPETTASNPIVVRLKIQN